MMIRDLNAFENSLKDFAWLNANGLYGTDIDFVREKNGYVVMLEGKHIQHNSYIKIKYSQYMLMKRLTEGRGEAFFIAYNDIEKDKGLYYLSVKDIENRFFHREFGELVKTIDLNNMNFIRKQDFIKMIRELFIKNVNEVFN